MRAVTVPSEDPAISAALDKLVGRISSWATAVAKFSELARNTAQEQAQQAQHIIEWERYLRELQSTLTAESEVHQPEAEAIQHDHAVGTDPGNERPAEVEGGPMDIEHDGADVLQADVVEMGDEDSPSSAATAAVTGGPSPYGDDLTSGGGLGDLFDEGSNHLREQVEKRASSVAEDEAVLAELDEETAQAVRILRRLRGAKVDIRELVEAAQSQRKKQSETQSKKRSWWSKG